VGGRGAGERGWELGPAGVRRSWPGLARLVARARRSGFAESETARAREKSPLLHARDPRLHAHARREATTQACASVDDRPSPLRKASGAATGERAQGEPRAVVAQRGCRCPAASRARSLTPAGLTAEHQRRGGAGKAEEAGDVVVVRHGCWGVVLKRKERRFFVLCARAGVGGGRRAEMGGKRATRRRRRKGLPSLSRARSEAHNIPTSSHSPTLLTFPHAASFIENSPKRANTLHRGRASTCRREEHRTFPLSRTRSSRHALLPPTHQSPAHPRGRRSTPPPRSEGAGSLCFGRGRKRSGTGSGGPLSSHPNRPPRTRTRTRRAANRPGPGPSPAAAAPVAAGSSTRPS
jgi:hypothetical protein